MRKKASRSVSIASGNTLGMALCAALGIDHTTVSRLVIECRPSSAATVVITRSITATGEIALQAALERYELHAIDEAATA